MKKAGVIAAVLVILIALWGSSDAALAANVNPDWPTPTPTPAPASHSVFVPNGIVGRVTPEDDIDPSYGYGITPTPSPSGNQNGNNQNQGGGGGWFGNLASQAGQVVDGVKQVFHSVTIHFSYFSLMQAVDQALTRSGQEALGKASEPIKKQAEQVFILMTGFSADGLEHIHAAGGINLYGATKSLWRALRNIALAFLPLVFLANLLTYFAAGDLGPRAYTESLLQIALTTVFIIASLFLAHWVIRIGWGTSRLIAGMHIATGGATSSAASGPTALAKYAAASLGGSALLGLATFLLNPLLAVGIGVFGFYLTMFFLFLLIMAIMAIGLANIAIIAIAVIVVVMSPLAIVVGQFPGFRWVYGMWLKVLVGVAVYPVLSAILLQIWGVIAKISGLHPIAFLVHLAIIGLIVALNGWLAKVSFAAIGEASKKAWGATKALMGTAIGGAILLGSGGLGALASGTTAATATTTASATTGASTAAGATAAGSGVTGVKGMLSRMGSGLQGLLGGGNVSPGALQQSAARLRLAGQFMPGGLGKATRALGDFQATRASSMTQSIAEQRRADKASLGDYQLQTANYLQGRHITNPKIHKAAAREAQRVGQTIQRHPYRSAFESFLQEQGMSTQDFVQQAAIAQVDLAQIDPKGNALRASETKVLVHEQNAATAKIARLRQAAKGAPYEDIFNSLAPSQRFSSL